MPTYKDLPSLTDEHRAAIRHYLDENSGFLEFVIRTYCPVPEELDDLAQECILQVMRNAGTFSMLEPDRQNAYVSTAVQNICRNRWKRQKAVEFLSLSEDLAGELPADRKREPGSDTHLSLLTLEEMLPSRDWYLLKSTYLEDKPKEEIAAELGCSVSSLRSMLVRARKAARNILEDKKGGEET